MLFRKIFPKRDFFYDYFIQHTTLSVEAAKQLLLYKEGTNPTEIFHRIKKLEHAGDQIAHNCVAALHKTFITPIERLDIYRLITKLDDITDEIEDIAKLIFLYKLDMNRKNAHKMASIVHLSVKELLGATYELKNMKITENLGRHFSTINELEMDADDLFEEALSALFEEEQDVRLLLKWKEIYEHFETATDECKSAANIIEGIILEND